MRDDDSLFIATADYEEWQIEQKKRYEQQLRRDRLRAGVAPTTLAGIVGIAASRFNVFSTPQNLNGTNPVTGNTPSFTLNQLSVLNNAILGPDNASLAQKIIEDTSTNIHSIDCYSIASGQRLLLTPFTVWRIAFIAKVSERARIVVQMTTTSNASPTLTVALGFDLQSGLTFGASADTGWQIRNSKITQLSFGWMLCQMDVYLNVNDTTYTAYITSFLLDTGTGPTRRTTYQGDGTSGLYIWWLSMLPAGGWLLNNITFNDDFLNTNNIDLGNTGNPGFYWYMRVRWPNNSVILNGGSFFSSPVVTPPSFISVANSILTISNDVSNDGQGLTSACPSSTAGFVGSVFPYPNIIEGSCAYDPSKIGNFPVPTLWGTQIEMLTGQTPLGAPFRENDIFEVNTETLHELTVAAAPPEVKNTNNSELLVNSSLLANQNSYACMMLTPAENDGIRGLRFSFFNGQAVTTNANQRPFLYGPTVAPFPVGGSVGAFSDGDLRRQPLILGAGQAGGGWASNWDFVRVYQKF